MEETPLEFHGAELAPPEWICQLVSGELSLVLFQSQCVNIGTVASDRRGGVKLTQPSSLAGRQLNLAFTFTPSEV